MGNGNQPFFKIPLVQGVGASAALSVLVVITSLFSGGEIDCGNPYKDQIEVLTTTAEYEEMGIQVAVCIVDGVDEKRNEKYEIEYVDFNENDPEIPQISDTGFEVTSYFANFKIKDIQTGEIITKFPKGIELTIFYTEGALEKIYGEKYITPRVAFLAMENGAWSGGWEELGGTVIKEFGPEYLLLGEYERILVIKLWALPDPLIGGC